MKTKSCKTCYYGRGGKCETMHEPISGCWADEAEAKRREVAVKAYSDTYASITPYSEERKKKRNETMKKNLELRGGKTAFEVLDEKFGPLYQQNVTDSEIGSRLHIDTSRVSAYRKSKGLPGWREKDRPAPTGTAM